MLVAGSVAADERAVVCDAAAGTKPSATSNAAAAIARPSLRGDLGRSTRSGCSEKRMAPPWPLAAAWRRPGSVCGRAGRSQVVRTIVNGPIGLVTRDFRAGRSAVSRGAGLGGELDRHGSLRRASQHELADA